MKPARVGFASTDLLRNESSKEGLDLHHLIEMIPKTVYTHDEIFIPIIFYNSVCSRTT
jgi:hypothetical protein